MFRNLATHLFTHERITTTLEKAKEMRPFIERLIRRAKKGGYQGNVVLKQNLFTSKAIENVKKNLVPRYKDLPAGFTRVKYLGLRSNDKARVAYIEMVRNPIEQFEKNEMDELIQSNGLQTYWAWEHKLLKQEQQYFKNLI
jgi:ribosomal protein L17